MMMKRSGQRSSGGSISRLSVYLTCAFSALGALSGLSLYARAGEAALALGSELARLSELDGSRPGGRAVETLLLNGQRFHHAVLLAEAAPGELLDRLQADCVRQPGPLASALAEVAQAMAETGAGEPAAGLRQGVLRHEDGERGMLICFPGRSGGGLPALVQQLAELARTGSLAALGPVRYVHVERTAPAHSRVTALWSDAGLDAGAMFPSAGDAPGQDSQLIPRPPESRRLLSAAAEGTQLLLLHYASHTPRPSLRRFYSEELRARGFHQLAADPDAAVYQREDGLQVYLALLEQRAATQVTWVESRAGQVELELQSGEVVR